MQVNNAQPGISIEMPSLFARQSDSCTTPFVIRSSTPFVFPTVESVSEAAHVCTFYQTDAACHWQCAECRQPVEDLAVIEHERNLQAKLEADRNSPRRSYIGVSIDWLVAFTNFYNAWDLPTYMVQRIVKAATREQRCRFVELRDVKEHVGVAEVFVSHCWKGKWGLLVAAAQQCGARGLILLDRPLRCPPVARCAPRRFLTCHKLCYLQGTEPTSTLAPLSSDARPSCLYAQRHGHS